MNKPKIDRLIVVEGKYDKIKLSSLFDSQILVTNGFGIFRDKENRALIRRLGSLYGVIIATDSDGGGQVIRGHLKGLLPADKIACVYIPQIKGKESRKSAPSAEGYLGVEGTDAQILYSLFEPFFSGADAKPKMDLTRTEFSELGFSGTDNSSEKRKALCKAANLPDSLNTKSLIQTLNRLYTREEFQKLIDMLED